MVNVMLLPAAGCDFGGLTFSNFNVSASTGFSAATVGTGAASTATSSNVNLIYQLSSTPGVGPGDVLLSYAVTASPGVKLTGMDLTNDAIMGPVDRRVGVPGDVLPIGHLRARRPAGHTGSHHGSEHEHLLRQPRGFRVLHKDIDVGIGGFINDFSNSHDISPTPGPATLRLLGSTLTGMGLVCRRRGARLG